MKYLPIALILCLLVSTTARAQTAEKDRLKTRLAALVAAGDLVDAIPVAEEIVKLEKANIADHAAALQELTTIMNRSLKLKDERINLSAEKRISDRQKKQRDIIKNYRELINIYTKKVDRPLDLARVQSDLAVHLYTYGESSGRFLVFPEEEILSLLNKAVSIHEKLPLSNEMLTTLQNLAAIHWNYAELEEFYPVYKKYSEAAAKFGKPDDLQHIYADFLSTIGSGEAAAEVARAYSKRTAKEYKPGVLPNVLPRSVKKVDTLFSELGTAPPSGSSQVSRDSRITGGRPGFPIGVTRYPAGYSYKVTSLVVTVVIDGKGDVVDVKPDPTDDATAAEIRKRVATWKFRPYIHEGVPRSITARFKVRLPSEYTVY